MLGFHPGDPGSNPGEGTTNNWCKTLENYPNLAPVAQLVSTKHCFGVLGYVEHCKGVSKALG